MIAKLATKASAPSSRLTNTQSAGSRRRSNNPITATAAAAQVRCEKTGVPKNRVA